MVCIAITLIVVLAAIGLCIGYIAMVLKFLAKCDEEAEGWPEEGPFHWSL